MDYEYYDETDYLDDDAEAEAGAEGYEHTYAEQAMLNAHHSRHAPSDSEQLQFVDRLWYSYENCVQPSLLQVLNYLLPLLAACLLCRLLSAAYMRQRRNNSTATPPPTPTALHLLNASCGLTVLYVTLGERSWLLLLLLSIVSYLLLQLLRLSAGQQTAKLIALLSIGSQFIYELAIWQQRNDWPQLRGLLMIINMKLISLAFDLTTVAQPLRLPSIIEYMGYIYQPASCVLGPWISYTSYLDSLRQQPHFWTHSLLQLLCNVVLCLLSLAVSNCIAPLLGEGQALRSHWLLMYSGALSVRSSHYFVSYLSQALLAAAGVQLHCSSSLLGSLVSRPWHIEWPHSLSSLVRCWNIPMHEWLKRYIYTASGGGGGAGTGAVGAAISSTLTRSPTQRSTIVAIFCTYLVSSLLHGMDLRIYLVLLSLATFAQGETMLRRHLAQLASACVAANPCPGADRCRYSRCPRRRGWRCCSSWLVALCNLGFTLLAIFHLAYLGVVLLNETLTPQPDNGELSFLFHWSAAGYSSHYIGIGMFMLYLFIS